MRRALLVLLVVSVAAPAAAQNKAAAEAAFKEARRLLQQGKVAEACPKFEASLKLEAAPGTQLNLADCYARLGRTASAWANFIEVAETDTKPARAAEARRRAAALEPRLARLTVTAEKAPDLRVFRDGEDITALVGVAVPVDPGKHVVSAQKNGQEWSAETVAIEAKTGSVTVPHFWKEAPPPPPEPVATPPPARLEEPRLVPVQPPAEAPRKNRTLAWVVGGVGVASVATGLVFGGIAKSQWDDSKSGCSDVGGQYVCTTTEAFDAAESANRSATLSTVFVGVGVAAVAAGVVLWFLAPTEEQPVSVTPAAGPGEVGVVVRGTF